MTIAQSPTRVIWIDPDAQRPVCDVPWMGTSIVQADGSVNFCCYSGTAVGNVNQSSFEEIWNGSTMQQIRRELSDGRLPEACRSSSCPIFRGDELHHILDRMEGPHSAKRTGTADPHRSIREDLHGSELLVSRDTLRIGDNLKVVLKITSSATRQGADLFVCLRSPEGAIRFLPSFEDYAVPFETSLSLAGTLEAILVPLWDGRLEGVAPGNHEICAALFEKDSNPNLLSNCYWSTCSTVTVRQPRALQTIWHRLRAALNGTGESRAKTPHVQLGGQTERPPAS